MSSDTRKSGSYAATWELERVLMSASSQVGGISPHWSETGSDTAILRRKGREITNYSLGCEQYSHSLKSNFNSSFSMVLSGI